jgi:hypothetical protein
VIPVPLVASTYSEIEMKVLKVENTLDNHVKRIMADLDDKPTAQEKVAKRKRRKLLRELGRRQARLDAISAKKTRKNVTS